MLPIQSPSGVYSFSIYKSDYLDIEVELLPLLSPLAAVCGLCVYKSGYLDLKVGARLVRRLCRDLDPFIKAPTSISRVSGSAISLPSSVASPFMGAVASISRHQSNRRSQRFSLNQV